MFGIDAHPANTAHVISKPIARRIWEVLSCATAHGRTTWAVVARIMLHMKRARPAEAHKGVGGHKRHTCATVPVVPFARGKPGLL
jgi:hypothetical protein